MPHRREIVESYSGKIQAEKASGGGCVFCFRVHLPAKNNDDL